VSSEHCQHELHNAGTECADHALQGDFLCLFCSNKNPVPCKETAQAMIDAGTPGNLPPTSQDQCCFCTHNVLLQKLDVADQSLFLYLKRGTGLKENDTSSQ